MNVSLPAMYMALNLKELYVDNSTFLITGDDINNMEDFSLPDIIEHPSIIFQGLQACVQLEILSCTNYYLYDWEG